MFSSAQTAHSQKNKTRYLFGATKTLNDDIEDISIYRCYKITTIKELFLLHVDFINRLV